MITEKELDYLIGKTRGTELGERIQRHAQVILQDLDVDGRVGWGPIDSYMEIVHLVLSRHNIHWDQKISIDGV